MQLSVIGFEEAKSKGPHGWFDEPGSPLVEPSGYRIENTQSEYVVLDDALVCGFGGIAWRDFWICGYDIQYYPIEWRTVSWFSARVLPDGNSIELPDHAVSAEYKEAGLYVDCTVAKSNFAHFVHDLLPYGLVYRKMLHLFEDLLPAIAPLKWESQTKIFEQVFGIDPHRSLSLQGYVRFKKLVVVRRQTNFDGASLRTYHAGLLHAADAARTIGIDLGRQDQKVFLYRTQNVEHLRSVGLLHGRDFINMTEFTNRLIELGFVVLDPGLVSIETTASLLRSSKLVVGVHGANLANMIFCRRGTRVLELRPATGVWGDIEAIARCFRLDFDAIDQLPGPEPGEGLIDIERTLAAISRP